MYRANENKTNHNEFNVLCFDISDKAIKRTKKWAESLKLKFDYKVGDMIKLLYEDNSVDCILCRKIRVARKYFYSVRTGNTCIR